MPHTFDLEQGRFALSPRLALALVVAGGAVAGSIGAVHYRIGTAEQNMGRTADELTKFRVEAQTKTQAQLDCLRMQIANKGWRCPDAPQEAVAKRFQPTVGAWQMTVKGDK